MKCANCGYMDEIQCFDVVGADSGNVFCNSCNTEIDIDTGIPVLTANLGDVEGANLEHKNLKAGEPR